MKLTAQVFLIMIAMFPIQSFSSHLSEGEMIVYVTPNGRCYHSTIRYRILSRLKEIKAIPLNQFKMTRIACSLQLSFRV